MGGKRAHAKEFDEYGTPFGNGDYIGCYIDFKRKEISYSVNGEVMGVAFEKIPNIFRIAMVSMCCY